MKSIRLLTRGSALALAQARETASRLRALEPELQVDTVVIRSAGDRSARPFTELGTVGVFVKELEDALLDGRGDVAVHSLKDLPTTLPEGLAIAAVLEREDPRDALLSRRGGGLSELPQAAIVATSSPRRRAQLRLLRPDLRFLDIRGNVDTRIARLRQGDFDALVLALAGLKRLGRAHEVSEALDLHALLPAPGQAAVALEARLASPSFARIGRLDHAPSRAAVEAERSLLLALGGGCSVPVGAYGRIEAGRLLLTGLIAHPERGARVWQEEAGDPADPAALGRRVAQELAAAGGTALLDDLRRRPPLAGRHILVTRARAESEELAVVLRERGATVESCPAIEIVPPADPAALRVAARRLGEYEWLVFTSANAVAALAAAAAEAGTTLDAGARHAAVGPATGRALMRHGIRPAVVAEETSGEGLGAALVGQIRPGDRVLFPRAEGAARALPEALLALGARIDEVEAYRTQAPSSLVRDLQARTGGALPDLIAFASPSAVRNFVAALEAGPGRGLREVAVACIGPRTAAAARQAGLAVAVEPASSSVDELAESIVRYVQSRG